MRVSEGMPVSDPAGSVLAKTVYCGGAIDYDPDRHATSWIHDLVERIDFFKPPVSLGVYCPRCTNADASEAETMARNAHFLRQAELALFRLDGTFTIGTPIEIDRRLTARPAGVAVWVDRGLESGLFVREFSLRGAVLLHEREEAAEWLRLASR